MMKNVNIAILGLGTVGGGTYEILSKMNRGLIENRTGVQFTLTKVLERDLSRLEALGIDPACAVTDPDLITEADDVDIVIFVIAGVLPAAGPEPVEDEIVPVLELLGADSVVDFPHPQAVVVQEVLQDLIDLIPQALAPPPDTSRPAPRPCPCRW